MHTLVVHLFCTGKVARSSFEMHAKVKIAPSKDALALVKKNSIKFSSYKCSSESESVLYSLSSFDKCLYSMLTNA